MGAGLNCRWPWVDLGVAQPKPQKLSRKMFWVESSRLSLSQSRKMSELSRASHKNFHFNQNQTSNRQPRHLSLWTRIWDCWRTWNLTTTVTAMETAMTTIPAKRFASCRRWQLTCALQFWQRTRKCQQCFTGNATVKRIHISVKLLKFT